MCETFAKSQIIQLNDRNNYLRFLRRRWVVRSLAAEHSADGAVADCDDVYFDLNSDWGCHSSLTVH